MDEALDQGYKEAGYRGAMKRAADALIAHFHKSYANPTDIAILFVEAGEPSRAVEWLEKGYEVRDQNMPYIGWPVYDSAARRPALHGPPSQNEPSGELTERMSRLRRHEARPVQDLSPSAWAAWARCTGRAIHGSQARYRDQGSSPSGLRPEPDRLRRFEKEARAAAPLHHPNILAVYDAGTHEGAPFIVSELLQARRSAKSSVLPCAKKAVEYASRWLRPRRRARKRHRPP